MKAEPVVQPRFRLPTLFLGGVIAALVLFAHDWFETFPNRTELGRRPAEVRFDPLALDSAAFRPLRLAGAWRVTSADRRFGGISALALDGASLLALSDSGVIIRMPRPGQTPALAELAELPGGPGSGSFKRDRDSEALTRDPSGRGWWVAFENSDELWLYDPSFRRSLRRTDIEGGGLDYNVGAEGLAATGSGLLLVPEKGGRVHRLAASGWTEFDFDYPSARVSDAVALSQSSILLVERRLTPLGFANALVRIDRCPSGYCFAWRKRLPLGVRDNVEALAVEPGPSGGSRLWLMTDNNGQRRIRTLLIALDLPAGL